jgi:hypothetical protein
VFENRFLRRIFGPQRDEIIGGRRKMCNEELHNLYSLPSAQNVLHEIQCMARHVSAWTAALVQRCRGSWEYSDRHPQCDGEVPLHCQQELHTQRVSRVPTGKNPDDSNLASMEVMQWVLLYLSIGHDRCY